MEKDTKDKLMKCFNELNEEFMGYVVVPFWRIKDKFARDFPELKDFINSL